jgi:hypothetical protein
VAGAPIPNPLRSADCVGRIAGVTHALALPRRQSAAALRSLFLAEPQQTLANGAAP